MRKYGRRSADAPAETARGSRITGLVKNGVGPPDAVNTGGPVPLIEILAGKGGFAGQGEATIRP